MNQKLSQKKREERVRVFEDMKKLLHDIEELIVPEVRFNSLNNFGTMVIDGPIVPEYVFKIFREYGFAINFVESVREKGTPSYATHPMFVTSMHVHFYDTL
jgi:hypothetical protein